MGRYRRKSTCTTFSNASYPTGDKMTLSGWIRKSASITQKAIITKWNYNPTEGSWAFKRPRLTTWGSSYARRVTMTGKTTSIARTRILCERYLVPCRDGVRRFASEWTEGKAIP